MLKDAEKFVGHFHFRPMKRMQTLHTLEVGDDHASGVAENVRDHEDLVPTLVENQVRVRRGWAVGGFSKDPAFYLTGIFSGDHSIDGRRNKNVTRQREEFAWIDAIALIKRAQITLLQHVLFSRLNIDPFGIEIGRASC